MEEDEETRKSWRKVSSRLNWQSRWAGRISRAVVSRLISPASAFRSLTVLATARHFFPLNLWYGNVSFFEQIIAVLRSDNPPETGELDDEVVDSVIGDGNEDGPSTRKRKNKDDRREGKRGTRSGDNKNADR